MNLKAKRIKERLDDEAVSNGHIPDSLGRVQEMLIDNDEKNTVHKADRNKRKFLTSVRLTGMNQRFTLISEQGSYGNHSSGKITHTHFMSTWEVFTKFGENAE
ncbi:MAG: hypothetical protein KID09_08805 [Paenibacillus macerans]|uniref:hypothetical protein n=1 Tax=Paenibacillus macerans TaxID=44252 RepID=UPI0024319D22|nr:hypothetical protein [Paenibacillus macerans]MBS5910734.1 hypothetical protein [Paenibacillus macerans]